LILRRHSQAPIISPSMQLPSQKQNTAQFLGSKPQMHDNYQYDNNAQFDQTSNHHFCAIGFTVRTTQPNMEHIFFIYLVYASLQRCCK
jgi:hypothetical protein